MHGHHVGQHPSMREHSYAATTTIDRRSMHMHMQWGLQIPIFTLTSKHSAPSSQPSLTMLATNPEPPISARPAIPAHCARAHIRTWKSPLLHILRTHFSTLYAGPWRRSVIFRYITRSPLAENIGTCSRRPGTCACVLSSRSDTGTSGRGCRQGSERVHQMCAALQRLEGIGLR